MFLVFDPTLLGVWCAIEIILLLSLVLSMRVHVFNYCCLCMCFNSCRWLLKFIFDFTIHHSGNFEWNPSLEYIGGEVSTMANVDPDLLSHFEIQDICAEVGGSINNRIYYLIPGGDLEQGLGLITSDDDVTYMLNDQQMKSHFL